MKRSILLAAFAALALTACQQDLTESVSQVDTSVFTATAEGSETRTALSQNGNVYDMIWRSGDGITIVDGAKTPNVGIYVTTGTGTQADFSLSSGSQAMTPKFKAYYPWDLYNNGAPTLPYWQEYVEGNIAASPMYAESNSTSLAFKNLCGIIRLNLSTKLEGKRVRVITLNAAQALSGTITNAETLSSDGYAAVVSGSNSVNLDCGAEGVAVGQTAVPFYIAVPAGTYTDFSVVVTTTDGYAQTRVAKVDIEVTRSGITTLTLDFDKIGYIEPAVIPKERAALEAFYKANDGDNWKNNENWCTDKPLRDWFGLNTDAAGHVTEIRFWDNNLCGYIPKEIADLTELETLSITNSSNSLSGYGPIPEEIGQLKKLKALVLQSYSLNGKFPESLFDLTELETLILSNPTFFDPQPFPQGVVRLKNLKTLRLNRAGLTGTLPAEMGTLYDLEDLWLEWNQLEGSIPESFGSLKNLSDISLNSNGFSGVIPSSLRTLDNYWKLWPGIVSENRFTMEDLRASACPAPRSPKLTALSGKTVDLEEEFKKKDYTVLFTLQWMEGHLEFLQQLETLRRANPNLGVVTFFDNNNDDPAERKALDNEFKALLEQSGAGWESFIRYFTMLYPEGEAPLYCTPGMALYPGGNNNVVVIGPDNTVVFTTLLLNNLFSNKHQEVIAYLEKVLDSPIERYESSDYSADKQVKQLQKASVGNGIDLVITGDAFSDRLIADGTFEERARNAAENLFSAEPFKSLRNRFNIYLVNAVSKNEEYFNGCSTVFSGNFGIGPAVGGDNDKVLAYAKEAIPTSRMDNAAVLVLMNSSKSGGTCYMLNPEDRTVYAGGASIAWLPYSDAQAIFGQSGTAATLVHELGGHGIGKLADEYFYSGMGFIDDHAIQAARTLQERGWYMNVDFTDNPSKVLWSRFIDDPAFADEGIGTYQGGYVFEYGVWRPTYRSVMFESFTNPYFNAPCRAQIYKRIMKLSEGPSWEFDYDVFVGWDKSHPNKSAAPSTKSNYVELDDAENAGHVPPVILNKTWRQVIHRQ